MSDDEEDWFEQARREFDRSEESDDHDAEEDAEEDTGEGEDAEEDTGEVEDAEEDFGEVEDIGHTDEDSRDVDGSDAESTPSDEETERDVTDHEPDEETDDSDAFGFTSFEDEEDTDGRDEEDETGDGFDDAFERGGAEEGAAFEPGDERDSMAPDFAESNEFDAGGGGESEFGFGSFGGDEAEGGPGAPSDGPDFDEEEFDSDLDRIDVGIEGLDEMILGGVPRRSLMTTIGSAGTGKTTFALQFLTKALSQDERAVYITLEESHEAILSTAEEKGWPFRQYESDGLLAVVSIDPIEMANSLDSIGNELARLIGEFGAERLVLDSVSLLEMMYDHPSKRRSEIFEFTRSLKEAGVTTMLTSEASESNPYASRHGIVEYLTDAVFILQYVRPSDFRETRLAIEIQKIRNANHSRETKPFEITNEGISVYRRANIF
ncbi:KaiC domain-containing protein [Halopenitus sp. H-Gu1]|uniref:KaiC domain-containing protein n=1 Tax=Halopenitus sp. H-Gu1 TaxID=3242697 RepID=UPI00359D233F